MKWEDLRRSSNVEDLRSVRGASRSSGGRGSMRLLIPIAKFLMGNKYGRIVLGIGVLAHFMGYSPLALLSLVDTSSTQQVNSPSKPSIKDNETAAFVSTILAQTEDVWHKHFQKNGIKYQEPKLVLFRDAVNSGCGYATKQTGPFYCPADKKVYLDMSFFDQLKNRHNAPGDFAQAYVIAHEVGHHVQNLLGVLNKSHSMKQGTSKKKANAILVQVELQADCYAGIWAHFAKDVMDQGDIEEALNAASAIGDDTLQKQAQGYVVPDAFTHGSSADRVKWFTRGYKYGDTSACQTGI